MSLFASNDATPPALAVSPYFSALPLVNLSTLRFVSAPPFNSFQVLFGVIKVVTSTLRHNVNPRRWIVLNLSVNIWKVSVSFLQLKPLERFIARGCGVSLSRTASGLPNESCNQVNCDLCNHSLSSDLFDLDLSGLGSLPASRRQWILSCL